MKKIICLICLLFLPLLFVNSQQKNNYVELAKKDTVTLNIISADRKQVSSIDNVQLQLSKMIENQTIAVTCLAGELSNISRIIIPEILDKIEERNKNDSEFVLNKLGFTEERVTRTIRVERWLNFTVFLLAGLYLLVVFWDDVLLRGTLPQLSFKVAFYLIIGFIGCFLTLKLLTFLFNGDYYVIKELMLLYT